MQTFQKAVDEGIANSHTYAAAMNVNVLCGNLLGAEKVMNDMVSRKRKRDIIQCTTLLKGFCNAGMILKAFIILIT